LNQGELRLELNQGELRLELRRPVAARPYHGYVTSANAYELAPHTSAPAEAVDAAEHGQVVYLTRNGQPIAAIVPANVGPTAAAAVEALEDAEDIRAARAALADPAPSIPMADILARYADDLATYPDEQ
jgi:antitoxin (DNA-binding transcriptional repressor) of toxin-antitoxin stability system